MPEVIDHILEAQIMESMSENIDKDMICVEIGALLHEARVALDDLIRIRVGKHGALLELDEGDLIGLLQSLQFLVSDLHETRVKKAKALRVVK